MRVREAKLEAGDSVLIRNVGLKGKNKLAGKWNTDIFIVLEQPDPFIPVYRVKRDLGRSSPRTLHRNMLLPITGLPLSSPGHRHIPDIPEIVPDSSTVDLHNTEYSLIRSVSSSIDDSMLNTPVPDRSDAIPKHTVDSRKDISSINVPSKPGKYIIPQRRKLNPTAPAFVPSQRPQRDRSRPTWMKSTDWLVS